MLSCFQVNCTQPLLQTSTEDMLRTGSKLLRDHDVIQTEIPSSMRGLSSSSEQTANTENESAAWPAGTQGRDGCMQWTWGGHIHMVLQGWCLPKGTHDVSVMVNLWLWVKCSASTGGLGSLPFPEGMGLATEEKSNLPLVLP